MAFAPFSPIAAFPAASSIPTPRCRRHSKAKAWLHNISEFVVRIDETLAAKEPVTPEYTSGAFSLARKMFVPTESGDSFQKKYFDAIQRDPAVVIDHAELARLFNNEPPDSPTP